MKDIVGYEGMYAIEEDGRIWSYKTQRYLIHQLTKDNYYRVGLCKDSSRKKYLIHRLIALTYIPNPENKPFIDHIDRNRTNNSINNLRWVSRLENNQNTTVHKDNSTNEINIGFDKRRNTFRVRITRNGKAQHKYIKTLQEAIVYRDKQLNPATRSGE